MLAKVILHHWGSRCRSREQWYCIIHYR